MLIWFLALVREEVLGHITPFLKCQNFMKNG